MKMKGVICGKKAQIALVARKYGVLSVELFGSCARGVEKDDSDIYLAVLVIPNGNIVERDKAFAGEGQMLFDRKVNLNSADEIPT